MKPIQIVLNLRQSRVDLSSKSAHLRSQILDIIPVEKYPRQNREQRNGERNVFVHGKTPIFHYDATKELGPAPQYFPPYTFHSDPSCSLNLFFLSVSPARISLRLPASSQRLR